ncbi:hypothetical protein [Aquirufa regiilacus]|uniref:Thiol:disulfide interchange protein DsbD N-terminal domain-containing protein n=1 Tax=Aquirufa regiilacus TaxID=3024868 RepID=A0ABU3TPA9_9BACT|nr:hypothetical protein [Aquirufa sp. LEOWEIH-7C]MDU0807704.1 hypothetical protein [Aquirufa sp. LEOWEIH-7C]
MKRILSIMLLFVLLYQAGGFALRFIAQDTHTFEAGETIVVEMPISLPYQTDWDAPQAVSGEIRQGDNFYQMKDQQVIDGKLVTTLVADQSARDRFFDLAAQVNEHMSDQPDKAPAKSKLINTLVKEYCAHASAWVLYVMEWPSRSAEPSHPVLSTTAISADFFSPPRQA